MFAAGLRPYLLRELTRFPDLILRPQMHQKRLAAGLRWGSIERSPDLLTVVGVGGGVPLSRKGVRGYYPRENVDTFYAPMCILEWYGER